MMMMMMVVVVVVTMIVRNDNGDGDDDDDDDDDGDDDKFWDMDQSRTTLTRCIELLAGMCMVLVPMPTRVISWNKNKL